MAWETSRVLLEYQIFEWLIQTAIHWLYRLPRPLPYDISSSIELPLKSLLYFLNLSLLFELNESSCFKIFRVLVCCCFACFCSAATNFSSFRFGLMTSIFLKYENYPMRPYAWKSMRSQTRSPRYTFPDWYFHIANPIKQIIELEKSENR